MAMRRKQSAAEPADVPKPTLVPMAPGYRPPGTKTKFLPWSFAESRLRKAHNYWVCTTRSDGRPHAAPVWGLWLERAFYFSTDPSSAKAKNLRKNSNAVVHVESGDEVVLMEGKASVVPLTKRLDGEYFLKYGMRLVGFPAPMVVLSVTPSNVSAWREAEFSQTTTRWTFRAVPPTKRAGRAKTPIKKAARSPSRSRRAR
jgi:general stress protein 26